MALSEKIALQCYAVRDRENVDAETSMDAASSKGMNFSSWPDVLEKLIVWLYKSKQSDHFFTLKTTEDRVKFCIQNEHIRTQLSRWLDIMSSSRHRKYWEKASELRVEGNASFAEKKYEQAVEIYTQSILAAPFPEFEVAHEEELALSFANRSAAFFHLSKYKDCLKDIERALHYSYPKHLAYKLHLRRGQCFLKLSKIDEAKKAFDDAKQSLLCSQLSETKLSHQEEEIEKHLKSIENLEITYNSNENENDDDDVLPDLSYGQNSHIPSASTALDVCFTQEKGRYIVANRDIHPGDTLFIEKPYASVLLPSYYDAHCHHCYAYIDLTATFPCRRCSQVRYCSEQCAEQSWLKYHHLECGNLDLLHSTGIAHLTFRLIAVTGIISLLDFFSKADRQTQQQSEEGRLPGFDENGCYGNDYNSVFHLVTHSSDIPSEDVFPYSVTATLLLLLLERTNFFIDVSEKEQMDADLIKKFRELEIVSVQTTKNNEQNCTEKINESRNEVTSVKLLLGCLLMRHTQQLICNGHAITKLETEFQQSMASSQDHGVMSQQQVRIATAIYPSASLMNHSCDPTIISSFHKDILIVRAIKDVPTGGEIYNCYGPHFSRMQKSERQQALKSQYFFTCECEACVNGDEREQRFQALKCPQCEGALTIPDISGQSTCLDCKQQQDCTVFSQKVFSSRDLYVQGVQLAEKGNYKDALEKFKKSLRLREQVMYKDNRDLAEVRDQISRCYASLGDFRMAAELLIPSIDIIERQYGRNSIEIGNELQKLSDLQLNVIMKMASECGPQATKQKLGDMIKETEATLTKALQIFSIHYGPNHASIKDLKEKQSHLQDLL